MGLLIRSPENRLVSFIGLFKMAVNKKDCTVMVTRLDTSQLQDFTVFILLDIHHGEKKKKPHKKDPIMLSFICY